MQVHMISDVVGVSSLKEILPFFMEVQDRIYEIVHSTRPNHQNITLVSPCSNFTQPEIYLSLLGLE